MRSLRPTMLCLGWAVACAPEGGERVEVHDGACVTCHADDRDATKSPPHAAAMFGDDCGTCHDQNVWQPAPHFVHNVAFPLELGHDGPLCTACHGAGYEPGAVVNQCIGCHAARATAVVDPDHGTLGSDCAMCHDTAAFRPSRFVHPWELEGVHATLACSSCHGAQPAVYEGKSSACVGCHEDDKARADSSVTGHADFPADCASCHDFESF